MIKSELSIVIDAPPERVFARIVDHTSKPEDWPSIVAIKDIGGEGLGSRVTVVYKMLGMPLEIKATCTEYVANKRVASEIKGGINARDCATLEPCGGGTKLTYSVEYAVPVPLVGKIAEHLLKRQNERDGEVWLANLKARVESQVKADA